MLHVWISERVVIQGWIERESKGWLRPLPLIHTHTYMLSCFNNFLNLWQIIAIKISIIYRKKIHDFKMTFLSYQLYLWQIFIVVSIKMINIYMIFITPILNVSRKISMCINLILDTLKFTTISLQMNNINNKSSSYNRQYITTRPKHIKYILKVHSILQWVQTNTCWLSIRLQAC
jgi:hypothetical protein